MRTASRDLGLITMAIPIVDAASGAGVAGNIPYTWTRTGGGQYTVNFDTRITPLSAVASAFAAAWFPLVTTLAPGTVIIALYSNAFALTNGSFRLNITALDKR